MRYKVGDRVLVMATIGKIDNADWIRCDTAPGSYTDYVWVKEKSIHDFAPAPEVDWSKVEMGTPVRARDSFEDEWFYGRFITRCKVSGTFCVLDGNIVEWWNFCEEI